MRAVIVGGSRGIGRAIFDELNLNGHETFDFSRSTTGEDVTTDDPWQRLRHLNADVLVYCAGYVEVASLLGLDPVEWAYHFDVNVHGAFRALQEFAAWRGEFRRPGVVVFVASTAGTRPSPYWGAYAASKAALVNLALTAAVELAPIGIRVYCVAPGRCATALRRKLAPEEDQSQIMQPAEVARAVMPLIDDVDGVLAGQVIEVKRR